MKHAPIAADPLSGWIEHDGTGCPLPYETLVNVRLSGGTTDRAATFAGFWSAHGRDRWRRQRDWYVAAYRVVPNELAPVVRVAPGKVAA